MDFSAALTLIRQGGIVSRPGWNGLTLGVLAPPSESGIMPFLAIRSQNGQIMAWFASNQEIFADDWVQVSSGEVAGHG